MSKPQVASEPSMEEILASIRKMIADDRPGPSPMPDQMGRTPFGEPAAKSLGVSEFSGRAGTSAAPARGPATQPSNFNSLADALKVATGLSDQRRSLQREIADVLERGPFDQVNQARPSSSAQPTARNASPGAGGASQDKNGLRLDMPGWRDEAAAPGGDGKREPMSFEFGTVVPQRTDDAGKSSPARAEKSETKAGGPSAEEPRIVSMPSRSGLNGAAPSGAGINGHHGAGLNGAATPTPGHPSAANGATVAPFPRSGRDGAKDAGPATGEKPDVKGETADDRTEALLDAVVDLVQQQPSTLSVFTSGASFIGGVGKKANEVIAAAAAAANTAPSETTDAAGAPPVPAKLDRAAAELLRPMLRQWLADNMPRIVEEALRSEITDTAKGDGKSGEKD
jgi:cell pole-organizing protein PopZ